MNKKINLEINKPAHLAIKNSSLEKWIKQIARISRIKNFDLSLAFVSSPQIEKINQLYRQKKKPTDVLSFTYLRKKNFLSGEIVICWSQVKKNAKDYQRSAESELKKVLVHSLLHLLGYDHQKPKESALMEMKEKQILKKINS